MKKTVWRWVALVTGICGVVAMWALPFPPSREGEIRTSGDARLRTEERRVRAVLAELSDAVAGYRRAQAIARWQRAGTNGALVTIDPSVPADQHRMIDSIVSLAWKHIGVVQSRYAGLYVFYDTLTIPGMVPRRAEPGRGAEVTYALPETTDGTRCITIVRLRRLPFSASPSGVLGPCAFYATFGAPGPAVRRWLVRTRFLAARRARWADVGALPTTMAESWYDLDAAAASCLTRGGRSCLETINVEVPSSYSSARVNLFTDDSLATSSGPYAMVSSDPPDVRVLSDMVQEFGPERFRAFWTSTQPPEQAFARAMGRSLIDWTRGRLERVAVAPARAAVISWDSCLWLALALPALIALSARRRETVLVGKVAGGA
jgi:hypothetical protein